MAERNFSGLEIREAPGLRRQGGPTVALSLGQVGPLFHAVLDYARAREWQLIDLALCGGTLPLGVSCQGALVNALPGSKLVRGLQSAGCAVVRLGSFPHPLDEQLPAVLPDDAALGQLAAEHFADRGFRGVGYVGSDPWSDARPVFEAFRERATELGVQCHLLRFKGKSAKRSESVDSIYRRRQRQFSEWLQAIPKPLGLLGYHNRMAAQLCFMSTHAGYKVPTDIAVLGRGNDVPMCECSLPTLSSVDSNREVRGREACRLLEKLMKGEAAPTEPIMVPPREVVVRESTDVLATPDPHVASALRHMWAHLDRDLSVDSVAREVGISRRTLERGFRHELGRGINVELRRKRLETLCLLLRSTDHKIADLAPMVGFKSTDYLHRTFRRAFGITPRKYRLRERGGAGK